MKSKGILRNINILNIILMAAVIAFAAYSVFPTLETKVKYALPSAKKIEAPEDKDTGEPEIPSVMQYTAVVDENLFHPERRIPPEKKEEQPLPKPDFVLYGTMVSDSLSIAYLEDLKAPRNTPGRGKRQVALKKGDSMSGFILREIETDKITMVRGEEKLIVAMNDPQKPKSREVVAPASQATQAQPPRTGAQQRAPVQPQNRTKIQQAPAPAAPAGQQAVVQPSSPFVPSAPATPATPSTPVVPPSERKKGGFGTLFRLKQ
jgi:hypothetical protein